MTVLELDGVTFRYGETPVVEDISLSLTAGEFLGLVGPNGSGKSTLLALALGLLRPDCGTIRLFGEPAHTFEDGERVGHVAQDAPANAMTMPVTVREVVSMGRYPHLGFGRLTQADREAIERALSTVGIGGLAGRRLGDLSGGQRQRAFIARALAGEADLLALDEPAVGVDTESREAFYGLLGDLNKRGLTIILVEHDIGVVTRHASRVACLNRQLFFHGPSKEFGESDALARAYGANQRFLAHDHA